MPKIKLPSTFDNQRLMYDQIKWAVGASPVQPTGQVVNQVRGLPPGTPAGKPYWEFDWHLDEESGIRCENLVVRDTQGPGSSEPVASWIDFTDLNVGIDGVGADTSLGFDVASALSHQLTRIEEARNGTRFTVDPGDSTFQYGIKLTLVQDFADRGVRVTLIIAIVFRGEMNDFDPGGIPWALEVFPQIGYTWSRIESPTLGGLVRRFRGSVRVSVNNRVTGNIHGHVPEAKNVANLFADSNTAFLTKQRVAMTAMGSIADPSGQTAETFVVAGYLRDKPFGWGLLFDYNRLDVQREQEYAAVHRAYDGSAQSQSRTSLYYWPPYTVNNVRLGKYQVTKAPRQGFYDNIHLHARMPHPDLKGNEQIHAPFCGHSCVHMHWRWSVISSANADDDRGWQYKGWWSGPTPFAHAADNAPLIPPNQQLTVALCRPAPTRVDFDHILPTTLADRTDLDDLNKVIWYCVDVVHSNVYPLAAGKQQVIMEAGFGWGYRYSTPADNSKNIIALLFLLNDNVSDPTSQEQLMEFFETKIYPAFRYWEHGGVLSHQVPQGNFSDLEAGTPGPVEAL